MKKKMTGVPFSGTAEQEAKLRKELKEIAKLDGCAMPALQKAQEIYGYLPMEVQQIVSEETGIPLEKIFGITTQQRGNIQIKLQAEEDDDGSRQAGQKETAQLGHTDMLSQEPPQYIHRYNILV